VADLTRHGPPVAWPASCPPEWFAGLPVLVAGLGRSGRAAARHLAEAGAEVAGCDDAPDLDTAELAAYGVKTAPGPAGPELLEGRALLVVAPGLPEAHPLIQAALRSGIPVWSEIELAARVATMPLVGVTGTNGKTTTSELAAAMLTASGIQAVAAGNVGLPLIDAVLDRHPPDALVVELSSFQLRFTWALRLRAGAWLNFAADHLDWHPDLVAYAEAKAKVWANQGPDDWSIYGADDPVVAAHAADAPGRPIPFTTGRAAPGGLGLEAGVALSRIPGHEGGLWRAAALRLPGWPWPWAPTRPAWPGRWPPSGPGRTGWREWARSAGWRSSTTPRRPTRTPPPAPWPRSRGSSGWPAAATRAWTSTSWSPEPPAGWSGWCWWGRRPRS
jgi:UDP-N-acetylmuramoylalanine--D-glutamate ligase